MAKHNKKENSYKELNGKLKGTGIKYYSPRRHIAVIFIVMFVCTLFCVGVFPIIINLIVNAFVEWKWMSNSDNYTDFLGGFIGVVIGFLFDLMFIERIRNINRYRALLKTLSSELYSILQLIYPENTDKQISNDIKFIKQTIAEIKKEENEKKENNEKKRIKNKTFEQLIMPDENKLGEDYNNCKAVIRNLEKIKDYCKEEIVDTSKVKRRSIRVFSIDDIVSSVENDSLFSNLPRYFAVRDYFCKEVDAKISTTIHSINGCILHFNKEYDGERRENLCKCLVVNIAMFYIMTDKNKLTKILLNGGTNNVA